MKPSTITSRIKKIESLLPKAMCVDRHTASMAIQHIKRSMVKIPSEEKITKRLDRLEQDYPDTKILPCSWPGD
jgi:hypothetical protein